MPIQKRIFTFVLALGALKYERTLSCDAFVTNLPHRRMRTKQQIKSSSLSTVENRNEVDAVPNSVDMKNVISSRSNEDIHENARKLVKRGVDGYEYPIESLTIYLPDIIKMWAANDSIEFIETIFERLHDEKMCKFIFYELVSLVLSTKNSEF